MCSTDGGGLFIVVDVEERASGVVARGERREPGRERALYHMRVSVPTIPTSAFRTASAATASVLPAVAAEQVASFLSKGKAAVITGAGVSVDSGIRAYRGEKGSYLNPNYKCVQSSLGRVCMADCLQTDICA